MCRIAGKDSRGILPLMHEGPPESDEPSRIPGLEHRLVVEDRVARVYEIQEQIRAWQKEIAALPLLLEKRLAAIDEQAKHLASEGKAFDDALKQADLEASYEFATMNSRRAAQEYNGNKLMELESKIATATDEIRKLAD